MADIQVETIEEKHNVLDPLKSLLVPIDSINEDAANARSHDQRNINAVKISLDRFGQHHPIIVQKEGMVVRIGNCRLVAAKELGWTHIATLVVDEDNVTATARAIADNRTGELAEWNTNILAMTLGSLSEDDIVSSFWTAGELEELGLGQFDLSIESEQIEGFAEGAQFVEKSEVFITGAKEVIETEEFRQELSKLCESRSLAWRIR